LIDHPTPAELEAFVWDRGPAGGAPEIAAHLIRCEACLAAAMPHLLAIFGQAEPSERLLSPEEDAAYEAALDRAFATTRQRASQVHEERKREALVLLAGADPDALPVIPASLRGIPLVEALLELSRSYRHGDPERMIRLAEWAWFFAEKGRIPDLSPKQLADFQCKVLLELGNAYRVADDLDEAQHVLGHATVRFVNGTGDELLEARLLDVNASFFGARRDFDVAEAALYCVVKAHLAHGDKHRAGRALIKKGIYVGYQGEAEEAVRLLRQGLELAGDQDPGLVFLALHNQARFLADCGRLQDAQKVIFELRRRDLKPAGRISELKVRWLEGQIHVGLGRLDRAERALRAVKEEFNEIKLGYKAALAALELGAVLLRQGDKDGAQAEIVPALNVFLALKIQREALAVVLLLKRGAERRKIDAKLLEYVISLLRRGEDTLDGE
jgi:tetratricopeptide (TPR) repeat protein